MAQITIRNLDDAVLSALKRRALQAGVSMEEEARRTLAMAVGVDRKAARAQVDAVRSAIGKPDAREATTEEIVRQMRDERGDRLSG